MQTLKNQIPLENTNLDFNNISNFAQVLTMKLVCAKIFHLARMLVFYLKVSSSDQRGFNLSKFTICQYFSGHYPIHSNLNVFRLWGL